MNDYEVQFIIGDPSIVTLQGQKFVQPKVCSIGPIGTHPVVNHADPVTCQTYQLVCNMASIDIHKVRPS